MMIKLDERELKEAIAEYLIKRLDGFHHKAGKIHAIYFTAKGDDGKFVKISEVITKCHLDVVEKGK